MHDDDIIRSNCDESNSVASNAINSEVMMPGYECDMSFGSGVSHSTTKLNRAASDLITSCPGLFNNNNNKMVRALVPTEEETLGYRCSCRFQILKENNVFHYAMRKHDTPIILSFFPIATPRVQQAMGIFLNALNGNNHFPNIAHSSLTSIKFQSSWDNGDTSSTDLYITLQYSSPILQLSQWSEEAMRICGITDSLALIGRSKKKKTVAYHANAASSSSMVIRDTIRPSRLHHQQQKVVHYCKPLDSFYHPNGKVMMHALDWILSTIANIQLKVSSSSPSRLLELYCGCGAHTLPISKLGLFEHIVAVEMDDSLVQACQDNWELNAEEGCSGEQTVLDVVRGDAGDVARLALHKRRVREKRQQTAATVMTIVDPDSTTNDSKDAPSLTSPIVGERRLQMQKQHLKKKTNISQRSQTPNWWSYEYHVLLVDPPKQGLDSDVCNMAIHSCLEIQHIVYISCGREALKRDLNVLKAAFHVESCIVMDLFPRTDAVETLVHLSRRR